jgi:hypothetical protein
MARYYCLRGDKAFRFAAPFFQVKVPFQVVRTCSSATGNISSFELMA